MKRVLIVGLRQVTGDQVTTLGPRPFYSGGEDPGAVELGREKDELEGKLWG